MTLQIKHIEAIRNAPRLAMQFNHSAILWYPSGSKNDNADQGGQQIADTPDSVFQLPGAPAGTWNGRRAYIHEISLSDNGGIGASGVAIIAIEPFNGPSSTTDPTVGGFGSHYDIAHTVGRGISMKLGFFMDVGFRLNCRPTYSFTTIYLGQVNVQGTLIYSLEGGEGGI